jgi:hypothetical protein
LRVIDPHRSTHEHRDRQAIGALDVYATTRLGDEGAADLGLGGRRDHLRRGHGGPRRDLPDRARTRRRVNDDFYVVTRNYTLDLDVSAWGWIHLIIGVLMLGVGFGLYARTLWAVIGGIAVAMLSAPSNFFIPYYPIWALLLIGLDVWIIWSLTRPGAIKT